MRLWKSECSVAFIIHFIQAFLLRVVTVNQSRQVENYHLGFYDEEVATKYEQSSIIAALNVKQKNLKVYLGSDCLVFLMFLHPLSFPFGYLAHFLPCICKPCVSLSMAGVPYRPGKIYFPLDSLAQMIPDERKLYWCVFAFDLLTRNESYPSKGCDKTHELH